jgi:hypothetical protein
VELKGVTNVLEVIVACVATLAAVASAIGYARLRNGSKLARSQRRYQEALGEAHQSIVEAGGWRPKDASTSQRLTRNEVEHPLEVFYESLRQGLKRNNDYASMVRSKVAHEVAVLNDLEAGVADALVSHYVQQATEVWDEVGTLRESALTEASAQTEWVTYSQPRLPRLMQSDYLSDAPSLTGP